MAICGDGLTPRPRAGKGKAGADSVGLRELRRSQRLAVGREQILDVAERLFGTQGYQRTSVEQIGRASEYSAGAIYGFFPGKREILDAVLARRGQEALARMSASLGLDVPGGQMLLGVAASIIEFHRDYPDFGRLSTRIALAGFDSLPEMQGYVAGLERAHGIYRAAIKRGQHDGTIRQGDPDALALLVSRLVSGHHAVDPELSGYRPGISTAEILEIIGNALAPPAAG